ncbi:MAG: hypothetical protein QG622_698, partial [Actinomycetota bacterium]|nr:hypothetical protein [Actinomycetota bacterium]
MPDSGPDSASPQPSPRTVPDWERRFRAARVGLPDWAEDAPDRCVVTASAGGVVEVHSWEVGGVLRRATDRKEGTSYATLDPAGEWLWWFDDSDGDEYGVWRRQPFGTGPDRTAEDATGLDAAYPAGLVVSREGFAVVGRSDDGYGTRIHVITQDGEPPRQLYAHEQDAEVAALSEDSTLVAIGHSEHGDSRHPALRVVRVTDGGTVGELWDGPGRGVEPLGFSPVRGDQRLLVLHERRGRGELLVWDVATGEHRELDLAAHGVAGEVSSADWFRDGAFLLVAVDHEARTRLYRVDPADGAATPVGPSAGTVHAATTRPDGEVWMLWSSAAKPATVRDLGGRIVLAAPGERAPGSVSVEDVWVDGPGGRVHALLRRPSHSGGPGPLPLVIDVHGGPTAHDMDTFRPYPSAWVDHGYA